MDDPRPLRVCRGGRRGWSALAPGTYSPGCPGNTVECGLRDGNSGDPGHYDQPLPVLLASRAGNRSAAPPSCKATLHYAARGGTRAQADSRGQDGRAACRDRVCQYGSVPGGDGSLKKTNTRYKSTI